MNPPNLLTMPLDDLRVLLFSTERDGPELRKHARLVAVECRKTADDLRGTPNRDTSIVEQSLYWDRRAGAFERLILEPPARAVLIEMEERDVEYAISNHTEEWTKAQRYARAALEAAGAI